MDSVGVTERCEGEARKHVADGEGSRACNVRMTEGIGW